MTSVHWTPRLLTAAAICAWAAWLNAGFTVGQHVDLSHDGVQEAIQLGLQQTPQPYELIWRSSKQQDGRTVVGTVYTPFMRVAKWVHQHRDELNESTVAPTDIPTELLTPTLTIALQQEPACCPPVEPGLPLRVYGLLVPAPSQHLLLCKQERPHGGVVVDATTDLSMLRLFDTERAKRTAAVVTVPVERVRSGLDLVYELHRRSAGGSEVLHFVGFGMIRDSDIRAWR